VNFKEAKSKAFNKKLLGAAIAVPSIISTAISFLKMVYFRLDHGSQLGGMIARPFKQLVSRVFENTQFLNIFWGNSPTPNHMDLPDPNNIYFIIIYIMVFVGFAFYASGKKLGARLAKINKKIENQVIEESIRGSAARTREDIERATEIPSSSIFKQLHQLYVAPVVTAVVGALLIKFLGV